MTQPTAAPPEAPHRRRTAFAGIALLAVLAAAIAWNPTALRPLRSAWFDVYQRAMPRQVVSMPVVIVEIDERGLAEYGQWPWPRTLLAELVREILRHDPAAVGIDILMPEADRLSPERLLQSARDGDPVLASHLRALPSNDSVLAQAIAQGPVVVGWAGTSDATLVEPIAPPIRVVDRTPAAAGAPEVAARIPRFGGALVNVPAIDRAAAGHGLLSAGSMDDVIRRAPLVARVGDRIAPSLATEMLRVALGTPDIRLVADGASVDAVGIGTLALPTERDGQVRLHYAKRDPRRQVSAVDVLAGNVDPSRLERKLVLVGVTGLALVDYVQTPLGVRMPGSEVHAQLLENLYDQAWLTRPAWARYLEAAVLVLLGLLLVHATPRWRPGQAALLALGCVALPVVLGAAMFAWRGLVFDAALPAIGMVLLFGVLLMLTLSEAARQRRALERAMQQQRERAAFVAGELDAARRIQLGFLPRADALADEPRADVAARMTPAREVGGDLYDFFRRDGDRLFFLVGDVAGKGLSASLFMAVGKALYKSIAVRRDDAGASELMRAANEEISRDNPEMFFITAFAGILDLRTGVLDYCNAGHDNPVVLVPARGECVRLAEGAGPPLCTVEGFAYTAGRRQMAAGEVVCVVTDGVADAQDREGARYGVPRLLALLARLARPGASASMVVDAVCTDVEAFTAGAEPADDLTVLAVRWTGIEPA